MSSKTDSVAMKDLEKDILGNIQVCWKCRMCVNMCPTYEGWFTRSAAGRLMAILLHIKYGLGNEQELSDILFSCTTCRRCQLRCKMLSTNANPTDTIVKARQLLVKRAQAKEEEQS